MNDIAAKRWERSDGRPDSHSVVECLEVMLHKLQTGEIEAQHVIIAYGMADKELGALAGYLQAGCFDPFAQLGLLHMIKRRLDEQ